MRNSPRDELELALMAKRVAARVADIYTGIWNTEGKWYRQDFTDIRQYFLASGSNLKNGNAAGVVVVKNTPRSKPRAKKISVSRHEQLSWKPVDEKDVPDDIQAAARSK